MYEPQNRKTSNHFIFFQAVLNMGEDALVGGTEVFLDFKVWQPIKIIQMFVL